MVILNDTKILIGKIADNRKGETLVETLAAVLISAIAIAGFVAVLSTSTRIITKSDGMLQDYYTKKNAALTAVNDLSEADGEMSITLLSGTDSNPVTVKLLKDDNDLLGVKYYIIGKNSKSIYKYSGIADEPESGEDD